MVYEDDKFEARRSRVLLVDDQISVREMVAMVLDREGRFAVVAEAASGIEGLSLFRRHQPDLVVLGISLPEMGGPETLLAMRAEDPQARLLFYSGTRNPSLLHAALEAQPHGFVHKTDPLETLRQAFHALSRGHSFFGPFATALTDEMRKMSLPDAQLSPKQRMVLQMIAEGLTTREAAERLGLSTKTIEHYRTQLMRKLDLHDVASLTRYAVRCGLVD